MISSQLITYAAPHTASRLPFLPFQHSAAHSLTLGSSFTPVPQLEPTQLELNVSFRAWKWWMVSNMAADHNTLGPLHFFLFSLCPPSYYTPVAGDYPFCFIHRSKLFMTLDVWYMNRSKLIVPVDVCGTRIRSNSVSSVLTTPRISTSECRSHRIRARQDDITSRAALASKCQGAV